MPIELLIQYIAVGLIVAAALTYIIRSMTRRRKKKNFDSCCGCALSESCNKKPNNQKRHEDNKDLE